MSDPTSSLITGAGSGIGRAFATRLSDRGPVHLVDLNAASIADLASELPTANFTPGDVADPALMARVSDEIGAVDVLCLNAGIVSTSMGPPWEADPDEWNRVLGVNLLGVVNGLRSFVPLMLARDAPSHIIITASLAGAATWPGGGPYAASKHAALAVAEQAAIELADTHVGVTVVCPALVRTAMSDFGTDPNDVVTEALLAADQGRFAVIPAEWHEAVQTRAADLASGRRPAMPNPSA